VAVFKRKYRDATGKLVASPHFTVEFQHLGEHVRENSGMTSKAEAKAFEQKRRQEITDRVKHGKAPSITLGEAATRYFETVLKPGGEREKLKRDLGYINRIVTAFGADTRLTDIRQHDVATWRDELVTRPRVLPGQKQPRTLKPASANRAYTVLRAIINKARDEWQVDAPAWTLSQLDTDADRVRYLDEANEAKLLLALSAHVRDFITFLMDSGCRKGEAMELTWDRITWQGDRAVVRLFATDTKANRSRQVPLTMRGSAILRRLRERYPDATYVFQYEERGETRRIGNPRKAFETALTRAAVKPCGGDDFHIHDCRHHFASRLAQKGATLTEIRDLLGHADIKMTLRYSHLCRGNLDRAVALLD
jgi:integrase